MIEVTRNNYLYTLPQVESAINDADFLAVDTEFSGLFLNDDVRASLFDTSAERYHKIKKSVESFTLAQFGITAFVGDPNQNRYNATCFSFYLCPASFGSVDPRFSMQSSSIQFLSVHNFDFNKCFKEGLPHLNCHQELQILSDLRGGFHYTGDDHFAVERELQRVCSQVASWMCHCKPGDFLTVPFNDSSCRGVYIIQYEVRSRFPNVWTSVNSFKQIVVENLTEDRKANLETESKTWQQMQHQRVLEEMLGFTRVFRMLIDSKKPLVGHNLLTDLLFMYSKFHRNLPAVSYMTLMCCERPDPIYKQNPYNSYEQFKKEIHGLFPVIFDTKHLHHYLKKQFPTLNLKGAYNLEVLDRILSSQTAVRLTRMQPAIEKPISKKSGEGADGDAPHNAGYDSFLCGCVFVRISHLAHFTSNAEDMESATRPFAFRSYLPTMEKHRNCINVIRASTSYTKLDGEDPSCERPPLLHVSYAGPEGRITSQRLAALFSAHGTVDIKMISSNQAIVATSHFMVSKEILTRHRKHPTIRVTKYRYLLHSRLATWVWWSALGAASIGYASLLYHIIVKK